MTFEDFSIEWKSACKGHSHFEALCTQDLYKRSCEKDLAATDSEKCLDKKALVGTVLERCYAKKGSGQTRRQFFDKQIRNGDDGGSRTLFDLIMSSPLTSHKFGKYYAVKLLENVLPLVRGMTGSKLMYQYVNKFVKGEFNVDTISKHDTHDASSTGEEEEFDTESEADSLMGSPKKKRKMPTRSPVRPVEKTPPVKSKRSRDEQDSPLLDIAQQNTSPQRANKWRTSVLDDIIDLDVPPPPDVVRSEIKLLRDGSESINKRIDKLEEDVLSRFERIEKLVKRIYEKSVQRD